MFARWITEFNVLYAAASAAQAAKNAGQYVRLDSVREVRYTDGDVESFLAAVGQLTDGNISYPAGQTLDVDIIYQRVMTQLMAELPILDHVGFMVGEEAARSYIGLGTVPKTGQNVCVLSSETYDKLISAPWKRILSLPRARDLIREQFEPRLTAAVESYNGFGNGLVTITEGDDILFIPQQIDGVNTTWDSLCAAIDARNTLTSGQQEGDGTVAGDSGFYGIAADGTFTDHWTNQFYDNGDLVLALLEGDVDVLDDGLHCVLLSSPEVDAASGAIVLSEVDNNSGCLATTNVITPLVGSITGALDAVWLDGFATSDSDVGANFIPLSDEMMTHVLPNGLLNIGSCGSAKATSWIRILRFLRLNYPQEAKLLMEKSGRSKKTLPQGVNRIASMDNLLAEVMSNGQRDGYINSPTIAFNVTRLTRDEQDGPLFAGSSLGAADPGTASASPIMATQVNGWDRTDNSDGRYIVTPNGLTINFEHGTPSRFSGEWDAGRIATWCTDFTSDSVALGSGNVEVEVSRNLLSYPCADDGTGQLHPRYVPWSSDDPPAGFNTMWDFLVSLASAEEFSQELVGLTEFVGYGDSLTMESYHMTRGFMRGLAIRAGGDNDFGVAPGYYAPRSMGSIRDSGRIAWTVGDTITGTVGGVATNVNRIPPDHLSNVGTEFQNSGSSSHMSPMTAWFWDPNRTQMFGTSIHRWAGVYFDALLPHPYLPHPVAVSTAYVRLSDLIGRERPNENNCGLLLAGNPSTSLASLGYNANALVQIDRQVLDGDQMYGGLVPMPIANNSSTSWKAHVSQLVGMDLSTNAGYAPAGVPTLDSAEVLPTWEMFSLISNGCARNGCSHSLSNVMRSENDQAVSNIAGIGNAAVTYVPWLVEGETLTSVADGYGVVQNLVPGGSLIIRGKGLLFEGDLYTQAFGDLMAWYVQVFSGERSLVFSPFPGYWAPFSDDDGFISVAAPQVGANHNASLAQQNALKPATTSVGVNLVQNDWFRKDEDLSPKHARMRSGSLSNPWIRAGDAPGMVHLRYDNSMLGPIFSAMEKQFLVLGTNMTVGLTNSLFLEVQMAN